MTAAQRAHAISLLNSQPELGNRAIAHLVGRGVSETAITALRDALAIPRNKRKATA